MPNDTYSKIVLTVIAAALAVIASGQLLSPAEAQSNRPCGDSSSNACYVQTGGSFLAGSYVPNGLDVDLPCGDRSNPCYVQVR